MMSVLLLWWFMISLVRILLSRNNIKDTDNVNIDTLIRISLRIPDYFYWYLLTIIEQYAIMIHLNKNQTTVDHNTNNWNDCNLLMSYSSSCLYYLHYRSTSEKNRYDSDVLNDYDSDVLNDFSLPYYALHYRW